MKVFQKYRICKKCGISGGSFYARKRTFKTKKSEIRIGGICIICHRENEAIRNRRLYKLNTKKYYKRSRCYKINNKEKVNKRARLTYSKKVWGKCIDV